MTAITRSTADRDVPEMRRRVIRPARLLLGITVPLLLVLASAGLLFAWRDYNDRRTSVLTDTQLLARAAGADADRFLHDRLEALTLIADSPPVTSGDVNAMRSYFLTLADQPTYSRVSWYDLSGTRRASNLDDPPTGPLMVSGREYFRAVVATGNPYVDAAVISLQDGLPIITAAVPTFDAQGRLGGVLVNPITLDALEGIVATFQGRDSLVMVVDRANQLIADADPKTGFKPVTNVALLARARAQSQGAFSSVTGPLGQKNRLVGFAPAPTGDWVVLISRSADAAFAPVRETFIIELLTILGIAGAGVGGAVWLGRRLDREAAVREQAHEAAVRLATIVGSSDDAIIGLAVDGAITSWNAGAERMFGHATEAALARAVESLVTPDRSAELAPLLDLLRQGRVVQQYETVGIRDDGTLLDLSLTLSPIRNTAGRIAGGSAIARDITEHKRVEGEREQLLQLEHQARSEAEAANRVKDEFLSVISHELRTPLTAIVGFAQLLNRRQSDDPQVAQMVATIDRSARVQMRLVNDLLDLSRVMTAKLELDLAPVDVATVVEAAVGAVLPAAEEKGITLTARLDPAAGEVLGDADRLQQVVANLLGNALKFTPRSGRIDVELSRAGDEARLVVRDNGAGISPDFIPHVFERFRQADASHTRAYGGLGLGLAIVRSLVELHGGRVEAMSEGEGRGATFSVWLPLLGGEAAGAGPTAVEPAAPPQRELPALAGRLVLLVEDDDDTRDLLRLALESEGARVLAAASAAEAHAVLERELPDALVCDIGMPVEDGYTFLKKVQARGGPVGRVPAIAVTAYVTEEDRTRALAGGFKRHLSKPVDTVALVRDVAAVIGRAGADA